MADGIDHDCDGLELCYGDADGDGVGTPATVSSIDLACEDLHLSLLSSDCDDADAGVYPGAVETIGDGQDADCDGGELCLRDVDDDGYLSPFAETVTSSDTDCDDLLEGSDLDPMDDCDDLNASVHPQADEICDGLDNDCDQVIDLDEDDGDADGYAPCQGDCNDTSDAVYPLAQELCDGIDNDCDDVILEDQDQDGFRSCGFPEGPFDCRDDDPLINACFGTSTFGSNTYRNN